MMIRRWSLVCAIAMSVSCGGDDSTGPSDDNDDETTTGSVKTVTVSVNGTTKSAIIVSGTWFNGQFTLSAIFGTGTATQALTINALNFGGPGTFALGPGNPSTAIATWVDGNTGSFSSLGIGGTGTLTLTTARTGHIKGTFSFTGAAQTGTGGPVTTVTITNGQFEVKQ